MSDSHTQEVRLPFILVKLDDFGLSPHEFRVAYRIIRRGECFETVPGMAAACRMNKKTAWTALARLAALNVISAEPRHGRTTVYRLRPLEVWAKSASDSQGTTQPETRPTPSFGSTQNGTQPDLIPRPSNGSDPTQTETRHPTQNESHKGNPLKVTKKVSRVRAVFIKPSMEEVEVYFQEIGVQASEASRFHDHHESKGWVIGKTPMCDWKAACRTWKHMGVGYGRIKESTSQHSSAPSAALSEKEIERRKLAESL